MATVKRARNVKDLEVSSEIENLIKDIKKNKGERTAQRGNAIRQPFRIRTDIFTLDYSLLGGIPHNRTTQIYGRRHGGKTTLSYKILASAQKYLPGKKAVIIDAEDTFDEVWARKNGVDTEELIVIKPDTGEDAVDMTVGLIRARETAVIVLDSLAALVPYKESDGSAQDEAIPGLQAKLITRMLRRATAAQIEERKRDHFVSLVLLNQFRCLDKGTNIWTRRGLLQMKDIVKGDEVESSSGFSKVLEVVDSGVVHGVEVDIKGRAPLRMSLNHKHMVVGGRGDVEERFAADLKQGDWVVINGAEVEVKQRAASEVEDDAILLGIYFADGCVTSSRERPNDRRLSITERSDERRAIVQRYFKRKFEGAGSYKDPLTSVGKPGVALIDKYEAGYSGKEKRVPLAILRGSKEAMRRFLKYASFDTHFGGRTANGFIWTFESEKQANDVTALLRAFGIRASPAVGRKVSAEKSHLYIAGDDAILFRERVGFAENSKQTRAEMFLSSEGARGRYDLVPKAIFEAVFFGARDARVTRLTKAPHYNALIQMSSKVWLRASRVRLLEFVRYVAEQDTSFLKWVEILSTCRYAEIAKLTPLWVDAMDIEVEGSLFFADGVLTHNSKIGGWSPSGDPKKLPGGEALSHYTSVDIHVKNKEIIKPDATGAETLLANEHSFVIEKNKCNGGMRSGEFRLLRRDDPETGLKEAEVDDVPVLLTFAKRLKWYELRGKGGAVIEYEGMSRKWPTNADVVQALNEDPELAEQLRRDLIVHNAKEQGMPQDFIDYLNGK